MSADLGAEPIGQQKTGSRWSRLILVLVFPLVLLWGLVLSISSTRAAQPVNIPPTTHFSQVITNSLISPAQVITNSLAPTAVDLSIEKSHSGNFSIGSDGGAFTITVTNVGDVITGPITVTDILASGILTPSEVTGTNWDCEFPAQTVTCVFSQTSAISSTEVLPPILMKVDVGTAAVPSVNNVATVTHPLDTTTANNSDTDSATVTAPTQTVDLGVRKTVSPTSPEAGDTITYTLVVSNTGPNDATGVILTDTLPTGLTFITATASTGTSYSSTNGRWNIGGLADGVSATLRLAASIGQGASGTITNTTDGLTADQSDGNPSNNVGTAAFTIQTAVPTVLGGQVTVEGSGVAISAATIRLVDSASHVYTTTTTTTGFYTITSTTTAPITAGTASVTATRRGYRQETASVTLAAGATTRQDFQLEPAVDLFVSKTDGRTTVSSGDTITYTISITNFGSLTANSIVITDVLPTNMTYVTDTLGIARTTPTTGTSVWKLPSNRDLAANQGLSFKLRATVSSSVSNNTSLANTVRVGSSNVDGNTADNVAVDTDTVSTSGSPSLSFTNAVSPSSASVGNDLTFTIRVTNNGGAAASNVVVTDSFSSYLNVDDADTSRGSDPTISSRTVTVNVGTLNAGQSVTITIDTSVNNTATTTQNVTNTASLTYTFGGSSQSRTSNTVTFQVIGGTTLPGTGWGPPSEPFKVEPGRPSPFLSLMFLVLGLAALGAGIRVEALKSERKLFVGLGSWLLVLAFLLSPLTAGWLRGPLGEAQEMAQVLPSPGAQNEQPEQRMTDQPDLVQIIFPTPEVIETLPDYPVPTPQLTPGTNSEEKDTSEVTRILIPDLGLDTVVKYVPYDGYTWMIAGLQQEVAWMGDTSWPGLDGKTVLAGHVTLQNGGNGPFRYLEELTPASEITLFTERNIYRYRVSETKTVDLTEISVLEPGDKQQISLITCTGWDPDVRLYMDRLVVTADLLEVKPRVVKASGN